MKNTLLRLCAAGLVLLGSLVPATAADSKLIVAMLPKSKGNAYFISVKAGADKAAASCDQHTHGFTPAGSSNFNSDCALCLDDLVRWKAH
jgi:ABC-type sugar transport system substrate-binding protein